MYKPKCYPYGCRLTAYSYVTGLPEETLVARIGHDGSEIVRKAKAPYNCRAFHPQELIDAIFPEFSVVEIHARPMSDSWALYSNDESFSRLMKYIEEYDGVIEGWTRGGNFHAIANVNGQFIDPDTGKETSLDRFDITEFYIVERPQLGL